MKTQSHASNRPVSRPDRARTGASRVAGQPIAGLCNRQMDRVKDVNRTARDTAVELAEKLRKEVAAYVATWYEGEMYAVLDDIRRRYAVIDVPHYPREMPAGIVVAARVIGEYVIIDEDTTDKPLYEALMVNAGVPREQIILAYAGETLPDDHTAEQDG